MRSRPSSPRPLGLPSLEQIAEERARRRGELQRTAQEDLEQRATAARGSLLSFVKFTLRHYQANWHHELLCGVLDDFVAGKIPRLIVDMPPRHGKSELVSRAMPAYILGLNPDASLIATSYSADLASMMNRDVQRIIDSAEYQAAFPGTKLSGSNIRTLAGAWLRNSDLFEVVGRRGFYKCAGVGGGITGMGGNYVVIDDPIKNQEEAQSQVYRDKLWEWYSSTLYTRLQGEPGSILLTVTRWHEDDLAGRLLKKAREEPEADQWRVISLPAMKEGAPTDIDPRKEGEALWPSRFPLPKLKRIKASVSPGVWSALYQQSPTPRGGNKVKSWWLRFYYRRLTPPAPRTETGPDGSSFQVQQAPLPKKLARVISSWDMPFKKANRKSGKATTSNCAGHVYGELGANIYLLDRRFGRMSYPEAKEAVRDINGDWPECEAHLIEDKAFGSPLIDDLSPEVSALLPIEPYGDKELRLDTCLPRFQAGNIWLPHPVEAPWVAEVVTALLNFPAHSQADDVDALTQAVLWLRREASPEERMRALSKI